MLCRSELCIYCNIPRIIDLVSDRFSSVVLAGTETLKWRQIDQTAEAMDYPLLVTVLWMLIH